jgi:hypothetical protein
MNTFYSDNRLEKTKPDIKDRLLMEWHACKMMIGNESEIDSETELPPDKHIENPD